VPAHRCGPRIVSLTPDVGAVVDDEEKDPKHLEAGRAALDCLARRVWEEMKRDDVSATLPNWPTTSYSRFIPLLIFLTSAIGLVIGSGTGMRHTLFNYLAKVMPPSAFQLINDTMLEVSTASGAGKLSLGLLAALLGGF
jgi:uncharacterized BrkB/YihY/UPF0761 family membrane protein